MDHVLTMAISGGAGGKCRPLARLDGTITPARIAYPPRRSFGERSKIPLQEALTFKL